MRYLKLPIYAVLGVIVLLVVLLIASINAKADHIQELVVGQDVPVIFICRAPGPMVEAAKLLTTSKEDADAVLQAGVAANQCQWLRAPDVGRLEKVVDTGIDVDGATFHVVIIRSPYNQEGFFTIIWVGPHGGPPAQNQEDS